jgi:predicted MPP superfamily phosphohydrolase
VPRLEALLGGLERPIVVLGNHDVAVTRDPFSRAVEVRNLEHTRLLRDETEVRVLRGERVAVMGVDPLTYRAKQARPDERSEQGAALRLLLCHFPGIVERIPRSSFDLILTGHLHAGQICLPLPGRRVTLAHPRAQFVSGLYETRAGRMHVSPGTGTTFVPLRFFARPEATELVLRRRN